MFKNNAESSLFELLCDVFSKDFQSRMPFVWFLMFISFRPVAFLGIVDDLRRRFARFNLCVHFL